MLQEIVAQAPLYLLIAIRLVALVQTAPLLSSDGIPQAAKFAVAGFAAYAILPTVAASGYQAPQWSLEFLFLAVGEAMIGIVMGFFLTMAYSAFSAAGQFFSLQMGFGASEVYDPLAQLEMPLVGQLFNVIGMYVFLATAGFQKLFLQGAGQSFIALKAADFGGPKNDYLGFLLHSFTGLFQQSLVMAFPILGVLFLVSVTMGLLSKAAPQMNLMSEGFPVSITVAFVIMVACIPFLMEAFSRLIENAFGLIDSFLRAGASA